MHIDLVSFTPFQKDLANLCALGLGTSSGFWQVELKQNCFFPVIHNFQPELQFSFFLELQRSYLGLQGVCHSFL